MWTQKTISLGPKRRGFHLVTKEVLKLLPEIKEFKTGVAHFFIQHTSASLTINENYDPDVRFDMESHFNHMVPENAPYYRHTLEGSDDMPAHLKTTIIGPSIQIPISNGKLALGTWQGITFCEHRDQGTPRNIVVTIFGEKFH